MLKGLFNSKGNTRKGLYRQNPGAGQFFSERILPWLCLMRVHNLFTVVGDPLAGACLASVMSGQELKFWSVTDICFCSLLLTVFGIIQNDWCDLAEDTRHHPNRPLPMRQIPVGAAATVAIVSVVIALVLAALNGHRAFIVAATMVILICAYNFTLKKNLVGGAIGFGLCRSLNVMLGASLVGLSPAVFVLMLAIGGYIALMTAFADGMNRRQVLGRNGFCMAGILLLGWLVTLPWTASRGAFLAPCICMLISIATILFYAIRFYEHTLSPDDTKILLSVFVANLIPYQACWLVMPVGSSVIAVYVLAFVFWLSARFLVNVFSRD